MKNKLAIGIFCFWFFGIFFLAFANTFFTSLEDMQLNPNDYARITDVEYKAVVVDEPDSEGKVVITERLTFDIHAASKLNPFWELWRDLPEDYVDGLKVDYTVNSVKQILEDGTEIIYEESPRLYWEDYDYVSTNPIYGPGKWFHSEGPYDEDDAQYECVFFYVDGLYREKVVYEIEYEMHNAALRYNDCSDLYLALYSGSTIQHLNSFKAQILFPNEDMPSPGNYEIYTYGTNSNEFPVTESATLNPGYYTFSFELDEDDLQFKPYNQYIEFDLVSYGEDKHIFTEYAPSNWYSYDDVLEEIRDEQQDYASAPTVFKVLKLFVFLVSLAGTVLMLIFTFTTGSRKKSKHTFYKPFMEVEYYRDIPSDLDPNFAAALVFCKHQPPKDDSGVYSAILLSLARKKYIELKEWDANTVQIKITKQPAQVSGQMTMAGMGQSAMPTTAQNNMPTMGQPSMQTMTQNNMSTIGQPAMPTMAQNNMSTIGQPAMPTMAQNNMPTIGQPAMPTMGQPSMQTMTQNNMPAMGQPAMQTMGQPIMSGMEQPTSSGVHLEKESIFETYEPLTPCEQYYFNLLVRHTNGHSILMRDLQDRVSSDYSYTDSFVRHMEQSIVNIGVRQGYFQKADYTQPKRQMQSTATFLMVIGILLIILVNIISYLTRMDLAFGAYFLFGIGCIISSIYLKANAKKYILLTQFGEDEYAKWRGLYNFLNSETLIHERTMVELPLWEKYLVYATAFGISSKVIKAISIRCPEATNSPILSNNYYRSGRFRHHGHSFRSSVRSGSSIARSGGSFGYGGGGRGGGGGGGGH